MKRQMLCVGVIIALVFSLCCTPVLAADCSIVYQDAASGLTIYRDSGGGLVFSGLPTPYVASPEEQRKSRVEADIYNVLSSDPVNGACRRIVQLYLWMAGISL